MSIYIVICHYAGGGYAINSHGFKTYEAAALYVKTRKDADKSNYTITEILI